MVSKDFDKMAGSVGYRRTSINHLNYNITEISQNTKKSRGDLRTNAATETLVKGHQLTSISKTYKD